MDTDGISQIVNFDFKKEYGPTITIFICIHNNLNIFPIELIQLIINICTDTEFHWRSIALWKEMLFSGALDNSLVKHKNNPTKKLITKFHSTVSINSTRIGNKYSFRFPKLHLNKYVYKNLRFSSILDSNAIEKCELIVGGSMIDTIYGITFKTLRYLYKICDNTVLPFSFCKDIEYIPQCIPEIDININLCKNIDNVNLLVDIYEICNSEYNPTKFVCTDIITQHQLNKGKMSPKGLSVNFKYMVNYIIIHIPNGKLIDFKLLFNGTNSNITATHMFKYDGMYIIPFTKSLDQEYFTTYGINFSRLDSVTLTMDIDGINNQVSVFAINYNEIRMGCYGYNLQYLH